MNSGVQGVNPLPIQEASQRIWDVAIIGAGPAGATAAIHLANQGHRIVLLDKDDFPRDKVCGDGLIADTIAALKRAGLYEAVKARGFETGIGTVYSPSRVTFDVRGQFITLKRILLDEMIMKKAVASGATFCKSKVADIHILPDDSLSLTCGEAEARLRARIVFVATGANVEIPTKLGLVKNPAPSAVALRCYVRSAVKLEKLIISYDRSITPGYAWIFPLGNGEFNIGCGIAYRGSKNDGNNLREVFQNFIESFPIAGEIIRKADALMPIKGARLRCGLKGTWAKGQGNLLVLGESIGATFPFTGEGIGKAMETGELAAEIAHQALHSGDFNHLKAFPERLEKELKHKFLGYQIAEDWFSKPWLNDLVARRISRSPFLQEAVSGLVNETVDPRKIFSLRGILRSFWG
ncbi:MAG: geranylgeranyl reductase family protein [Acidobacteria bacterium]|nr:geranylgeranyl reductase family protein [Acidobacteriota bacterium]